MIALDIALDILGTGAAVPERVVTTEELVARVWPQRDPAQVERRLGIHTRRWVRPDDSDAELCAAALRGALARAELAPADLRRIILVSTAGGDHLCPATANDVAGHLGIDDTCDVFDVDSACAGFLTGLDLAARSVATGLHPVAVVGYETWSRYVSPEEPRPYVIMGDGAAAVIVGGGAGGERGGALLASHLRHRAGLRGRMNSPHPGRVPGPARIRFGASREELTAIALDCMSESSRVVLAAAGLDLSDVDWFFPHQPNGEIVRLLLTRLGVSEARTVPVLPDLGSLGTAALPMSLHRAFAGGLVERGQRLLLTAVGGGTSYGAMLLRVRA